MSVEITITRSPENVTNEKMSHLFSEEGGSLGRGPNNTWVLDDPDKYMSSIHCRIDFKNGQYTLTDLSTNGTFVNGAPDSLASGDSFTLTEGDCFVINDYEFTVSLRNAAPVNDDFLNQQRDSGPFLGINEAEKSTSTVDDMFSQRDPFSVPANNYVPLSDAMSGFDMAETDPLAALDKASGGDNPLPDQSSDFVAGMADPGIAISDAVDWPTSNRESSIIPDNWDDDEALNTPVVSPAKIAPRSNNAPTSGVSNTSAFVALEKRCRALEGENKALTSDVARLNQVLKEQDAANKTNAPKSRALTAMDRSLIEALGLSGKNLDDHKVLEISDTVGLLVRETMEGMMRVLSFRKKIKEEFRINVTTIQPVENNPLKFSANIDDALENMFIKENNAYKEPVEAIREGFQGISEHQVAVLAGMQAAFRGMLERFDPDTLEKRFEKYKKSSLIQLGKKSKNWASYREYHAELSDNLDNSFQHLFGYDFVQAYEEQMQRLVIARKTSQNK